MWVQFLGQEDPLEEGMATHSRSLAWRMPWTEESGRLQSLGSQRVSRNRNDSAHRQLTAISRLGAPSTPWEKAVAPHSSTLAWKSPWTEEPGGLRSMGSLRVGHD